VPVQNKSPTIPATDRLVDRNCLLFVKKYSEYYSERLPNAIVAPEKCHVENFPHRDLVGGFPCLHLE
jgi:hypothetical protein